MKNTFFQNTGSGLSFAEVDLAALRNNFNTLRNKVDKTPVLAVVKANAYGHGAIGIAQFLSRPEFDVRYFGVAFLEEALSLRQAGIDRDILLMATCLPEQAETVVAHNITPVVYDLPTLHALNDSAKRTEVSLKIHIKIDTGMSRIGIQPEALPAFMNEVLAAKNLCLTGLMTHFAEANVEDLHFAEEQLASMKKLETILEKMNHGQALLHLANSASILHFDTALQGLVRPGLMLYGYSPLEKKTLVDLRPILQIKSRVIALKRVSKGTSISYGRTFVTQRESLIATVAIGYADGYPFLLSNRGCMIVDGVEVPVVGRICMDMCMLDVSAVPDICVGDWVTVMGCEGRRAVWADRIADWAQTHPYEILCGIGSRIERVFIGG